MEFIKISRKKVIQLEKPEEVLYKNEKYYIYSIPNKREIIIVLAEVFDKEMEETRRILNRGEDLIKSLQE